MANISERRAPHIFRDADGHLPDTAANRQALIELTADAENLAGYDRFGHAWYVADQKDGKQLWAAVREDEIVNGGLNRIPRRFHLLSGLSNPEKKR